MRDLNSQLHNEVQVGRALEDILQGDDIGVLDSEEDRPKRYTLDRRALPLCHQVALFAAHFQQRAASFPLLQKIRVRTAFLPWQSQLWEPLRGLKLNSFGDQRCGAWLCDNNKCYSHSPTENNLVMNQPTETWASLLAAEHTPEHMNAPSL